MNQDKLISVYDTSVSAREYISYIAEQAGGFAIIGRDGRLYIKKIGEHTAEVPIVYFQDIEWGDNFKVSKVKYEDGVRTFEKGNTDYNTVYINQENMYIVDQEQISNIYDQVKDLEVYSFKGSSIIDPAIDIGDIIIIDGKKTIYQGEREYIGKWKADIASQIQTKSKEETTSRPVSSRNKLRRVESSIDQITGEIKQVVEEQNEFDSKLTQVYQDIDGIKQNVGNVTDFTRTQEKKGELHLTDCMQGTNYVMELSIRNIQYLTPKENLVPSETLVPFGDYFTLVIDRNERSNKTDEAVEVVFKLDKSLLTLDEYIYDEININEKGELVLIRRIGRKDDGEMYKLPKDIVTKLNIETLAIPTFEPNTYIYIKEDYNSRLFAKWIIKNEYYATKLELNTSITQTANDIMLEVNKKVGEEELGTKIEQNAEAVKIAWNQISQYLKMEGIDGKASLAIYDENNKILSVFDQDGQSFFSNDNKFASMGVVSLEKDNTNKNALMFILDQNELQDGTMGWGYKRTIDGETVINPVIFLGKVGDEEFPNLHMGSDLICELQSVRFSNGYIGDNMLGTEIGIMNTFTLTDTSGDNVINITKQPSGKFNMGYKYLDQYQLEFYQNNAGKNVVNLHDSVLTGASNMATTSDIDLFFGEVQNYMVFSFRSGGNVTLWAQNSDARLKERIKTSKLAALDRIKQIKHRQFDWKRDQKHEEIGYIAQELEKIDPNYIHKTKIKNQDGNEDYDYQVNTLSLLATATKAIQELNKKVEEQQNQIEELNKLIKGGNIGEKNNI